MRWTNPSQKIKARMCFSEEVNKIEDQTEETFFFWMESEAVSESDEIDR